MTKELYEKQLKRALESGEKVGFIFEKVPDLLSLLWHCAVLTDMPSASEQG